MELTTKQQEGLDIAINRYKNHEKYTIISGYAGSGKSTLVKFIVSALGQLDINPDKDVVYSCFTGKACQVLLKKGNKNVLTLHKLLYDSYPKKEGGFVRRPKAYIEFKVVIVDEISMAPKELIDLLFQHNVYVIGLGDPFQLPPVEKKSDNHLLDHPHVFLDQIMRQAAESEIIRLSMKIRNGENFDDMAKGKEVQIFNHSDFSTGMMTWADQIIVATNQTRISINKQMRELLGRTKELEEGDKIICLRNYWDELSDTENALVNGTIGFLNNFYETKETIPYNFTKGNPNHIKIIHGNFITDSGDTFYNIDMDKKLILTGENTLDWKATYSLNKSTKYRYLVPMEFAFGYAITCHKAQGSEFEKVLIYEENFPFDKFEHARWLYTAITRSSSKLVLVR